MLTEHGNVARLDAQRTDKRSAARVADAQRLVVLAEELLFTAVVAERDRGVSWGAIGEALGGVSRSTAHGRFAERLEAVEHDSSAELALDHEWQRVVALAVGHLSPLISCIGALDASDRRELTENLLAAAMEPTLPDETRLGAAQVLATVEYGAHAKALEGILRRGAGPADEPRPALPQPPHGEPGRGVVPPARLLDVVAPYGKPEGRGGGRERTALMNKAIETFKVVLSKHEGSGNDDQGTGDARERIAALLLMRFDDVGDPYDLEQAIGHLRSVRGATGQPPAGSGELLAAALGRRYELRGDFADLADAIELQRGVVADKSRSFGSGHQETFRARFGLAQSIARSGDSARAIQQLNELLIDQLRVLSSDHPDVLRTQAAYAQALSECGEHGRAEQILAQQVVIQTRMRGADNPMTIRVRAQLLTVMVRRLTETEDAELIDRMDLAAWSVIADGLAGDHKSLSAGGLPRGSSGFEITMGNSVI